MQRELPGSMVLSADFVYTTSDLATLVNLNQPLQTPQGTASAPPYPTGARVAVGQRTCGLQGVDLGPALRHGYAFGFACTIGSHRTTPPKRSAQGRAFRRTRDFAPWFGPSD
jgi:hypothetical protein